MTLAAFLAFLDKAIALGYAVDEIRKFATEEIPELSRANQEGIPDRPGEWFDALKEARAKSGGGTEGGDT